MKASTVGERTTSSRCRGQKEWSSAVVSLESPGMYFSWKESEVLA